MNIYPNDIPRLVKFLDEVNAPSFFQDVELSVEGRVRALLESKEEKHRKAIENAYELGASAAQARITELETSLENLLSVHPLHPHAHQDTQDAHEKASNALRKETA